MKLAKQGLTLKDLKRDYRINSTSDALGDAVSYGFAICETLYERGEHDIPELMEFRPSPFGVSDDLEDTIRQELKLCDTDVLESFGRILNRLINILKYSGRDY